MTKGKSYQKGGSYHILCVIPLELLGYFGPSADLHDPGTSRAGKEGARAFGTGCFKEHMTHDKRGLTQEERDVCRFALAVPVV